MRAAADLSPNGLRVCLQLKQQCVCVLTCMCIEAPSHLQKMQGQRSVPLVYHNSCGRDQGWRGEDLDRGCMAV